MAAKAGPAGAAIPQSIDATLELLRSADYVADRSLATVLFLSLRLGRPLFLEGEAGVGKTEIAKVLSQTLGRRLIRLQCYEGLDAAAAVYEWNYAQQMMAIRLAEAAGDHDREHIEHDIFSRRYLIERPLLKALEPSVEGPPILLIDELDRTDEAFEAFLLEILSDFQITIPELGTIAATTRPMVILTANGTRDLSDALRRRCLYAHVDYPDRATELAILKTRCPQVEDALAGQIVAFVQSLRREELQKKPGIAEMLDFAAALAGLGLADLSDDPAILQAALATLLKTQADRAAITTEVAQRLAGKAA